MNRCRASGVLVTLVLPLTLVACSSDPDAAYCDEVADVRSDLAAAALLSGGEEEGAYLGPVLRVLENLRAESPADLRDEWDTFVFAWRDLVEVLEETGVDPTTFDPDERPEDLSQEDFEQVLGVGRELGTPRVRDAVRVISEHAVAVCETPFELETP